MTSTRRTSAATRPAIPSTRAAMLRTSLIADSSRERNLVNPTHQPDHITHRRKYTVLYPAPVVRSCHLQRSLGSALQSLYPACPKRSHHQQHDKVLLATLTREHQKGAVVGASTVWTYGPAPPPRDCLSNGVWIVCVIAEQLLMRGAQPPPPRSPVRASRRCHTPS